MFASFFKQRSDISHAKGTSALHIVYASFFKQRSDISNSKEQARFTAVYTSFFKERSDMSHAKEQARYTWKPGLIKMKFISAIVVTTMVVEWFSYDL